MSNNIVRPLFPAVMIILIAILACNAPSGQAPAVPDSTTTPGDQPVTLGTSSVIPVTPTVIITHTTIPSNAPPAGTIVYDVESSGTAAELRAPYGDSYDINRLERPFLQNMTYVPDLDIVTFTVSSDSNFWYVSIDLIGVDPNNTLGINYAVELDLDHDGFGDYVILAQPPYTSSWDTLPVQVFQDKNHDTGGRSGENSDAPITTDGYETLFFNSGNGDADPDMAWVRANAASQAIMQFAFKKSWAGAVFMIGVLSDAGLKDVGKLDYVDRFTEAEAGSPIKDKADYPLKALFAVDNTCREAFGFEATGYEPQLCPRVEPTPKPRNTPEETDDCQEPYPGYCGSNSYWVDEAYFCGCSPY
jgi:hypothetical protein